MGGESKECSLFLNLEAETKKTKQRIYVSKPSFFGEREISGCSTDISVGLCLPSRGRAFYATVPAHRSAKRRAAGRKEL